MLDERGLALLKEYGYIPCDLFSDNETVGRGLEYALADWCVARVAEKMKRKEGNLSLRLVPTKDIAAALGRMKTAGQRIVGFALETDEGTVSAKSKLAKKNLDFIVLNSLRDPGAGFGTDTNKVTLIDAHGETSLPLKSKRAVADDIINELCARFA